MMTDTPSDSRSDSSADTPIDTKPEIRFYHLQGTDMADALGKLLHVCVSRDWRALVVSDRGDYLQSLDTHLWGHNRGAGGGDSFLAHSLVGSIENGAHDGIHPILLSDTVIDTNSPYALFMLHGSDTDDFMGAELICRIFEGADTDSVDHARDVWKKYDNDGYYVTYWQQEKGSWVKKAEANNPEG